MFSLFGKGKGKGDDHSKEGMFSSAAATALAAAEDSSAPAAAPSTGRHLHGAEVAIDLDDLRPSEVVFELKVRATAGKWFIHPAVPCCLSAAGPHQDVATRFDCSHALRIWDCPDCTHSLWLCQYLGCPLAVAPQVQPITLVKTDFKLEQTQLVAVSDTYICYGLKAGHIRALDRNTGGRALFKGHPAGVSSMAFFSPGNNLLASVSKQGDIAVRRVSEKAATDGDDATIEGSLIMSAQLPAADLKSPADGPFAPVTLAWHPTVPQILAAGAGSSVHIFEVPTAFDGTSAPPPSQPGITYSIAGGSSAVITTVAFTPSGDLLVAGDSAGGVHAWWLEGEEASEAPLFSWQPFGGAAATGAGGSGIGSVRVLHQVGHGPSLLLTGNANNSTVKLWALPAAAAGGAGSHQPQHLQTVSFRGKQGSGAVFCHVAVQSDLQLVVLADTGRKQVYTLHYSLGGSGSNGAAAAAAFDYASFFSVKQPILSLSTNPEAADAAAEQQLLLYCVQTDAIQQYMLNTSLCMAPPGEEAESAVPAAAAAAASKAPTSPTAAGAAAAGSEVPPPAQLPTPTLLGARAASQKAPSSEPVASPAKPVEPATPAVSSAHVQEQQHQQQLQELEGVSSDGSTTAEDSRAAPLPPMPTSSLMHSAEKAPPATPTAAEQQASPAPQPSKPEPAVSRDAATPAAARAVAGASAAAAGAASAGAASAPAAASAAPGAGVSSEEVAALQQQMVQLLQLQERMAAQLQASSQQTVAGERSSPPTDIQLAPGMPGVCFLRRVPVCAQMSRSCFTCLQRAWVVSMPRPDLCKFCSALFAGVKAELGRSLKSTEGSLLKQVGAALADVTWLHCARPYSRIQAGVHGLDTERMLRMQCSCMFESTPDAPDTLQIERAARPCSKLLCRLRDSWYACCAFCSCSLRLR